MKERRTRRIFTPEQKVEIIQGIKASESVEKGLEKYDITSSLYYKWSRQYEVGIKASLRNSKPLKSPEDKKLREDIKALQEIVLNLTYELTMLKKRFTLTN